MQTRLLLARSRASPLGATRLRAGVPAWLTSRVHLLVCIVNNTAKVNDIVAGLVDIGITGATVLHSHGTADIAVANVPVFAGFRHLVRGDRQANRTILSVIRDDALLEPAMALVQRLCGDLEQPSTGIMFALPVSKAVGLAPKVE